jgi:GH24 family phage-related lysozyme (muramidase)
MEMSESGVLEVCGYEGVCLRPYFDSVGVITIGFGSTVTEIPNLKNWDKSKYISMQEAYDIFKASLGRYEKAVTNSLIVDITQSQFDALTSLCYNIGTGGLSNSTLIRSINQKQSSAVIYNDFLMWNKPREIVGRRTKEAHLYTTGVYSNPNGLCQSLDTDGNGHQLQHTSKEINIKSLLSS